MIQFSGPIPFFIYINDLPDGSTQSSLLEDDCTDLLEKSQNSIKTSQNSTI